MNFLNDTLSHFSLSKKSSKKTKAEKPTPVENTPENFKVERTPISEILVEIIENPILEDEMAKMNITIPLSLKRRFKAKCTNSGTDMSKMVNFWVKQFLSLDNIGGPHNEN